MALNKTHYINRNTLTTMPDTLAILRMSTTPPIARDRLAGLADVSRGLVKSMEAGLLPNRIAKEKAMASMAKILQIIYKLLDREIMPWIAEQKTPAHKERLLAASIIADRLCGSLADPIIRNEQERRQLESIHGYLTSKGYVQTESKEIDDIALMAPGTFAIHINVPVRIGEAQDVKSHLWQPRGVYTVSMWILRQRLSRLRGCRRDRLGMGTPN